MNEEKPIAYFEILSISPIYRKHTTPTYIDTHQIVRTRLLDLDKDEEYSVFSNRLIRVEPDISVSIFLRTKRPILLVLPCF